MATSVHDLWWDIDDSTGRSPPVAGKHMIQLCVLQRGWDTLMNDIAQFFAKVGSA